MRTSRVVFTSLFFVMVSFGYVMSTFAAPVDITTVAGTGVNGFSGDGGPATEARLNVPEGVFVDGAGNLFIADFLNSRIRRVDAQTGIISTVVGTGRRTISREGGITTETAIGSGRAAIEASVGSPRDVFIDIDGNLFIADTFNNRIRRVDSQTGVITTVAGSGPTGFLGFFDRSSGDGGPATDARLWSPMGIFVDAVGNLFIADTINDRIRRVDAQTGIITTVAGRGSAGFSGDGGLAIEAQLNEPRGIFVDVDGNLFIADSSNDRIRRVDAQTGIVTTVIGVPTVIGLRDTTPMGVFVDTAGNLLIAATGSDLILRIEKGASPAALEIGVFNPNLMSLMKLLGT
ncbi:MAG: hypothetical protein O7E52_27895 [Candidatus Poribacteria bacterium]|nr:hypothetical protein [Candidatus Poribacteria bacterium]